MVQKNKSTKEAKIGAEPLQNVIKMAKLDFEYKLKKEDVIIAVDDESPFIVLVKNREKGFFWAIDFLLSEYVENYNSIPRVKLNDYFKVLRCI